MQIMKKNYKITLYACYLGYITQAITVNLATLFFVIFRESFGISYTELGSIVLITFLIQIAVDASMVKLTYIIGYRVSAVLAHVFAVVGLILLGILPRIMSPFLGIIIAIFFYSIGGGMTEVIISPIVDSLPGDAKASGMCLLHSFYSWGQVAVVLITTIILKFIGSEHWYLIPPLWALLPLFNIFMFAKVPLVDISAEEKSSPLISHLRSPIALAAILLMICGGAAEQAMSQWASLFAETGLGVTKVVGDLLGPCLFALNMGIGRTIYGIHGEKINIKWALTVCSFFTVLCYALTVFAQSAVFSLIGCALCGLGVSLMWPGVLSMTSAECGSSTSPALFAFLALAGDVGCSLGPWITGKVSDVYITLGTNVDSGSAIRAGLLSATVFPAIMACVTTILLLHSKKKKSIQN